MSKLEMLNNIKSNIQNLFNLTRCNLSGNNDLYLVLFDNLSNKKAKEIAEYCLNKLERTNNTSYKMYRCKISKDKIQKFTCEHFVFLYREIKNIERNN